jgi:hypothetical protein
LANREERISTTAEIYRRERCKISGSAPISELGSIINSDGIAQCYSAIILGHVHAVNQIRTLHSFVMINSRNSGTEADAESVCSCGQGMRGVCLTEPVYKVYKGKPYCVLHFPAEKDISAFENAVEEKIDRKDFQFRGVWFPPDYPVLEYEFHKLLFNEAVFSTGLSFAYSTFNDLSDFSGAAFFASVRFQAITFNAEADFGFAKFAGPLRFYGVSFNADANFANATFMDEVRFVGDQDNLMFNHGSELIFQFARFEKPHLVSFHTVSLRPSSFVDVDARKFEFSNVKWKWRSAKEEVASLRGCVTFPQRIFSIACRNLAVNAEDNHRYEEASRFRYMAMDAERLERWRGFDFRRLSWWYWLASGYGERVLRAATVLLAILLVSAALYTQVGFARWEPRLTNASDIATTQRDEVGAPLKLTRALTYSVAVMLFQRPEPRPATTVAQTLVLIETILGPVQAALLALAIRRKFMR